MIGSGICSVPMHKVDSLMAEVHERGAMPKPVTGWLKKHLKEEFLRKYRLSKEQARKKKQFCFFVTVMTFFVHLMISPFILRECIGQRPDVILEISLKGAPYLPATLNYTLDDAYVIKSKNFTGVLFSHNDLKPDYWNHLFNKSVEFLPLASLVQTWFFDYVMIRYFIAANLPLVVSYGFGLLIFSVYEIVGCCFGYKAQCC